MTNLNTLTNHRLPSKSERHVLFGSVTPGPKTKPTEKEKMADLQNSKKDYLFDIDAVGINKVTYPVIVSSKIKPYEQSTIATFSLTSTIDRMTKGTNMSRFLEVMEEVNDGGFKVDFASLTTFAKKLQERLEQEEVQLEVSFPWFFERLGPTTGKAGLNHATVTLNLTYNSTDQSLHYGAKMTALITTLCPCSKEISEYSAHSQRGNVTMEVNFTEDYDENELDWKEALLLAAESNASAVIYPVLKRPDEKFVTESAYENPRFVEDVVRLVAADLYEMPFVEKFIVTCENEESIHLHNAIAKIEFDKTKHNE